VPAAERGTYAGAARKAEYLRSIGVTAVEFLPVQETVNDANDVVQSTAGDNYWGYMTLNYFAPDRRYAADKSPGGPTREFRAMAQAFHAQGIKVFIDVVYNHSAEAGVSDDAGEVTQLLTMRGLDNASYYELAADPHQFFDNTGIGANLNTVSDISVDLMIDSLPTGKTRSGSTASASIWPRCWATRARPAVSSSTATTRPARSTAPSPSCRSGRPAAATAPT
jgi:isoamylase